MSSSLSPIRASHSVHQLKIGRLGALVDVVDDMARNPRLLDEVRSRRFDRNDPPPPYESDPETELEESPRRLQEVGQVEEAEIISRPLSDEELLDLFDHFERGQEPYHPGRRYFDECAFEERRFIEGVSDQGRSVGHFVERVEQYRLNIMARHIIKKRWEKLRVWNPSWGVPTNIGLSWSSSSHYGPLPLSSNGSVEHDHRKWRWRWQGDRPMSTNRYWDSQPDTEHPNYRAVQLRKGTRRHEVGPRAPRSHLSPNAGASEADSFIISRRWYNFRLDVEEERLRVGRVPGNRNDNNAMLDSVFRQWEEEEMGTSFAPTTGGDMPSWKWKHESPEPAPVEWDDIEYTPSETDALEAIPPPTPPPRINSNIKMRGFGSFFFGPRAPGPAQEAEPATGVTEVHAPTRAAHGATDGDVQTPEPTLRSSPEPGPSRARGRSRREAAGADDSAQSGGANTFIYRHVATSATHCGTPAQRPHRAEVEAKARESRRGGQPTGTGTGTETGGHTPWRRRCCCCCCCGSEGLAPDKTEIRLGLVAICLVRQCRYMLL